MVVSAPTGAPSRPPAHAPPPGVPTRVAVVGAGYIAEFHLGILADTPDVEVVCVCDTDRGRAETAARRYGVPEVATDLADLAEIGVDVAHLCVPPHLHVSMARRALELGLGVFLEKPMATTVAEVEELERLARGSGVPLAVNHNNVFHPAFRRLVAALDAGTIGPVQHVRVCLAVPLRQLDAGDYTHWMFREPRNIVFEQAVHPASQLVELIGAARGASAEILSTRELLPGQPFHERWVVSAQAERGTAELYFHFGSTFTRNTIEVLGTDGCLEADLHHDLSSGERKTKWLDFWNAYLAGARRGRGLIRSARRVLWGWIGHTLKIAPRRDAFWVGMRDSIQAFHRAHRAGRPTPGGPAQAAATVEWCEAIAAVAAPASKQRELPPPGPVRAGEVVVTGATGFIGRQVVRLLVERGVPVTAIVRRSHSLPPEITEPARSGDLRVALANLDDGPRLAETLEGAAACIHLATGGGDTWEEVEHAMVEGSRRVGVACATADARLVYVSSIAALYTGPDASGSDAWGAIGDDEPTDPKIEERPIYARGKAAAERTLRGLAERDGLRLVIARPGVVLGTGTPMQHSGLGLWVRDNHCVGWGKGERPLPLVWVEDVAEALVRAALFEGGELDGRSMNLCARVPLSARDVVEAVAEATQRPIHFHARPLWLSQGMEIGKWLVKKAGRRKDAAFPSYRDLRSRSLARPFACRTARELLGWQPLEEREAFLAAVVPPHEHVAPE